MLNAGQKFPEFSLKNQDGKPLSLKDYSGKWTVFYVYPKDDTPGCTIQGKSFTATKAEFQKLGVQVVGISADDVESHKSFCNKYSLTIDLVADPSATLLEKLGVGQSEYKGVKYWNRSTFLVDPQGTVRKSYPNVKPDGHEQVLLDDIRKLRTQ